MLVLIPMGHLNPLAYVNQYRYELELPHEMQIRLFTHVQDLDDLFQCQLKLVIVLDNRYDLLLKVDA